MDPHQVLRRPVITEKSTMLGGRGQFVFEVDRDANKHEIKHAVEEVFKVNVVAVNTLWVSPQRRTFGRQTGMTKPWKKAIVSLAPGQRIELFPGT